MITAEFVILAKEGYVATLTINRPDALNALNLAVLSELAEAVAAVAASDARCLVIKGAGGRAFVAGADVAEMEPFSVDDARAFGQFGNKVFQSIRELPIPVLAAIDGFCLGGGLELALACDLRIASGRSQFAFPETGLGIMPGFGGTVRLPRLIGEARAFELIYTGRRIKADEALRFGLLNASFEADAFAEAAVEWGNTLASRAPLAIKAAKESMLASADRPLADALLVESDRFAELFATKDQKKGMQALLTKTPHDGFDGS